MKPGLYMGMLLNVLLPAVYFFIIYFLNSKQSISPSFSGEVANMLFYAFVGIGLTIAAVGYILRERMFKQIAIIRAEGAELQLQSRFRTICIIVGALYEGIAVLGLVYYFVTARFQESAILILIAAGAYQLVRPRVGIVDRFIETQVELFNRGERATASSTSLSSS